MDATTYIASRTILKGVCENKPDSFWCKPLDNYVIFLILLIIVLYVIAINLVSFYKEKKKQTEK
jgi:hypothetical protein